MSTQNYLSIIDRCDDLTKNGETLSISWNGGNDSGWFEMKLDDKLIENDQPIDDRITDLVADQLGYGSFAGDFSTDGAVVYNREIKCFEGNDTYSESNSNSRPCLIEIWISKDIWFDQLAIRIEANEEAVADVSVRFLIVNGPHIDAHTDLQGKLEEIITERIDNEVRQIDDLSSIWQEVNVNCDEFEAKGNDLVFTIKEFEYSFYDVKENEIEIYLTDQTDDDDTI